YSERSRNVIVDVRYLLWLLDQVEDAEALLQELGVGSLRVAGPRAHVPGGDKPAAECEPPAQARETGARTPRGCGCTSDEPGGAPWWAAAGLLWFRRRRGGV